jgi:hypothetical protein
MEMLADDGAGGWCGRAMAREKTGDGCGKRGRWEEENEWIMWGGRNGGRRHGYGGWLKEEGEEEWKEEEEEEEILVAELFKVAHDRGIRRDNLTSLHSCSSTADASKCWFCRRFRVLTQDVYFSNRANFPPKEPVHQQGGARHAHPWC